jgi:hypothetical protein
MIAEILTCTQYRHQRQECPHCFASHIFEPLSGRTPCPTACEDKRASFRSGLKTEKCGEIFLVVLQKNAKMDKTTPHLVR